jgi:YbbR domain-containing protein
MKGKFSLNTLLHNDKLMIICSAIAAVLIWALISFGPGNVQQSTVSVPVKVDLDGTIVGQNGLRVIGDDTFMIEVSVEGTRSTVFRLTEEDFDIRPSLADIQGVGKSEVSLTATKSGRTSGFTINSISPNKITLDCDYWTIASFTVTTDVTAVKLKDEKTQQFGDLSIVSPAVTGGTIKIEGPQTVITRIATVSAKVENGGEIGKTTRFSAKLHALDFDGNEVSLENCHVLQLDGSENTVEVTVPVWVQQKVPLTYTLANRPTGISENGLVTLTPSTITMVGEAEALAAAASTIGNLGTVNFDRLTPEDSSMTVSLNVPTGVQVLEGNTVELSLNLKKYTKKSISYSIKGLEDVKIENIPAGKSITLNSQVLSNIILCGPKGTLDKITSKDLLLTLDASSNTGTGSVRYLVRVTVPKYQDIWVYYGKDEASLYRLYGTLE